MITRFILKSLLIESLMRYCKLFMVAIFALASSVYITELKAQELKGNIMDEHQNPIDYANIIVKKSKEHTHSDERGNFSLKNINPNDTILVNHLLYENYELIIKDFSTTVSITLKKRNFEIAQILIIPETDASHTISKVDLAANSVNNAQELLRRVPGIIIGQHAGGGKAEQIFLRGFDIDHGTDINISVDGMPVNMVSHAHGQGYADMHFIIPETVQNIDYGKGPYDANKGNFATAGYVSLKTIDRPSQSLFSTEYGNFNTYRNVAIVKLLENQTQNAYVATEYLTSDGPFESSQAFKRLNLFAKYTAHTSKDDIFSMTISRFSSRWDASGQIPERAVANGSISRFGAIDDTEGGETSRTSLTMKYDKKLTKDKHITIQAYIANYDFKLYSNFTFFLNDPINGDQIKQKEQRNLYGIESRLTQNYKLGNLESKFRLAAGMRYDDINNVELSNMLNRKTLIQGLALGNINETNIFAYTDYTSNYKKWQANIGIRWDQIDYLYENSLATTYEVSEKKVAIASPKFSIQYAANERFQLFAKAGKGFHSNDTRVLIDKNATQLLPAAYGADLGFILKASKNLIITAAAWYLYLDQEFVYVGDGAIVEPSGRTRRQGLDLGLRYQPASWIFVYSDLNLANPISLDGLETENLIPLAPRLTNTGGINFIASTAFNVGLRYRYISDRPANEDNSIVASGYTVVDFNANYNYKNITIGIDINNLLNTEWNETQFATESRLQNESTPIEEIHYTPGTPFFIKGKISYRF